MPVFNIHHITKYTYDLPVSDSINEIRILPMPCTEQEVLKHDLLITHHPDLHIYQDYWGNKVANFSILESHRELVIESRLTIRTLHRKVLPTTVATGFEALNPAIDNNLSLIELCKPESIQQQDVINAICASLFEKNTSIATLVENCSRYIFNTYQYTKGITSIETTLDEILTHQGGVCQDFAHLLLQLLRTLHIPCRYVSGYICPNKNGMRGEGATHAWVEAYIPSYGWAGIDPTNNIWVFDDHVKLAVGRDFKDCSPVKGTFRGTAHQNLYVFVSIGYEDGHTFEETHLVQMDKEEKPQVIQEIPSIYNDAIEAQQQ